MGQRREKHTHSLSLSQIYGGVFLAEESDWALALRRPVESCRSGICEIWGLGREHRWRGGNKEGRRKQKTDSVGGTSTATATYLYGSTYGEQRPWIANHMGDKVQGTSTHAPKQPQTQTTDAADEPITRRPHCDNAAVPCSCTLQPYSYEVRSTTTCNYWYFFFTVSVIQSPRPTAAAAEEEGSSEPNRCKSPTQGSPA